MKKLENGQSVDPAPPPPRANLTALRLLVYAGLLLLSLATTASFLRPNQCRSLCSTETTTLLSSEAIRPRAAVDAASSSTLDIWVDVAASGVYSPALKSGLLALDWLRSDDEVEPLPPFLDELAEKGYLAIRVPHAPPTYTTSSLVPGIPPWFPYAIEFNRRYRK